MTPNEQLEEMRNVAAGHTSKAIELVLRSTQALLECVPMRSDATTKEIAAEPGADFETIVSTRAISVCIRAGDKLVEVYRHAFDAPAVFDLGDAR